MSKMVIITAAGTGGHVFPGLAVAKYLQQHNYNVHWVGSYGMEVNLVPKYNINISQIEFKGIRGKGFIKLLKAPFELLKAIKQAKAILKELQPSLILAMGGYISVPVGIAAKLLGIPLIIHEQNAIAGMANKLLSRISYKCLEGFDNSINIKDAIYTGNPMRENFANVKEIQDLPIVNTNILKILVIGGSLGASILNEIVPKAIELVGNIKSIQIVHQSGKKNLHTLNENYAKTKIKAHTVDFIEDMKSAYEWADIVICRAGAMTISEIATIGVPSILVPLPHAVDDHQTKNAQILAKAKAAWLIPQSQFTPERLANILKHVNTEKLRQMTLKARLHSHQNATQKVADICIKAIEHARN